jgi:hypothetical protein
MTTMRNCTLTMLFLGLVFSCGLAAAQQAPALIPKNPIRLTKVEGWMDHLGAYAGQVGKHNSLYLAVPARVFKGAELWVYETRD